MPHPPLKPHRLLSAVLMSSVLRLAACGGDDGDEAGSTPEGDVATSPASTESDVDDADGGGDDPESAEEAAVCDLLSDEEITELTGYEVVNA